ncbi:hypothetical protein RchiOBHm_Chr6g0293221 [Rosa chinensis]|uniref:Uncharacterized protein n=1 Tax=Rosa chinensis TaxID=74649 RepID=A0A2P6PWK6_ROSCH|nr:hypothetical protein RchiOBHm_Chr6g0293221 [Rosa chinensis]
MEGYGLACEAEGSGLSETLCCRSHTQIGSSPLESLLPGVPGRFLFFLVGCCCCCWVVTEPLLLLLPPPEPPPELEPCKWFCSCFS